MLPERGRRAGLPLSGRSAAASPAGDSRGGHPGAGGLFRLAGDRARSTLKKGGFHGADKRTDDETAVGRMDGGAAAGRAGGSGRPERADGEAASETAGSGGYAAYLAEHAGAARPAEEIRVEGTAYQAEDGQGLRRRRTAFIRTKIRWFDLFCRSRSRGFTAWRSAIER